MKLRNLLLPVALLAALPSVSHAHFLWASLDPSTKKVTIGLQEHPGDKALPLGDKVPKVKAWSGKTAIPIKSAEFALEGNSTGDVVGVSLDYGVLDRSEQSRGVYKLNYFAKAAANLQSAEKPIGLPVELILTKASNGTLTAVVLDGGRPSAGAEVVLADAKGEPAFEGKTDANGTLALPATDGAIAIRCMVVDGKKGSEGGHEFEFTRSYCTLTVPGAPAKPLTVQLRQAFGENHDVVGKTPFIETLMAGSLTKAQLEAHMQQRAFIHEEIDRILSADPEMKDLYGPDQKVVLTLLKEDMKAAGFKWPTADQAWPLTNEHLKELKEGGSDFALGVFHVYYGGITNGGRMIGAKIEETLKVPQAYYLKSDGYREYLKVLNGITDPKRQQQIVKGGVSSYNYIIQTNRQAIFKAAKP